MKKSPLTTKYGDQKRWVSWKLEVDKKGKPTKVPYKANGIGHASSIDPSTWDVLSNIKGEKVGIILNDKKLICIDMDHVLIEGKLDQREKEKIAEVIIQADTFTEISQSSTGIHIFFEVEEPLVLSTNKYKPYAPKKGMPEYEVYSSERFMTTSGNSYGEEREVRTLSNKEALAIIQMVVPQKDKEEVVTTQSTSNLNDQQILSKMFSSRNGDRIKRLYDGDISDYSDDASSADMALCSYLSFWAGRDAQQIERLWAGSELAKRDKFKRKDYRERTISNAIKNCKEVYTPPSREIELLFTMEGKDKDKKVVTLNTENIFRVLNNHKDLKGRIRYDTFKNQIEVKSNDKWREIKEADTIEFQTKISILFPSFAKVGKQMVFDAIIKVAKENEIDSAIQYITSIKWDGANRLDHWLKYTYGVEDSEYHRKVGSNWFKGLVKRLVEPGCKFDYVLVLEGDQGVKKSTSLSVLGGGWHVETTMSTDTKDFFMQFQGKAIIEFSEGETLSRTEVKRMKAIITMQNDRYRMPYERATQDFPRRCVFAMTTNQTEYLKDETGNRRWLPVATVYPESNIEWLKENRDQLFAEAYHRVVELKETIYEFPKEETLKAQRDRMIHDPNEEVIYEWYHRGLTSVEREQGITVHQVYKMALNGGFNSKPMSRYDENMISEILKNYLHLKKERVMIDGVRSNRYFDKGLIIDSEKLIVTNF